MSKVLRATCEGGTVTALETEVESARILSEGVGASEGILVLDEERADYLASNASDIKKLLTAIVSALGEVSSALSSIDAKPTGGSGSAPAPAAGGNVSAIDALKDELDELKDNLK